MTDTVDPLRIPLAHSVRYVVRGLPDVPYQYGRGVLRPSEITLTYRTAPDSQLGRVHAYIAGRLWVDGAEIQHAPYGQHYDSGLDSWPAWLTEEARLHDPDASTAIAAPATDRAAGVAEAIRTFPFDNFGMDDVSFALEDDPEAQEWVPALAAAVLATLPATTARAVELRDYWHQEAMSATTRIIELEGQLEKLRGVAVEAQQPETEAQPPHHRWYVETRDGLVNEWAPGMRFTDRAAAAERYQTVSEHHPTWKDGTPVKRRLVRETTSYTVEPEPAVDGTEQPTT